MFQRIRKGLRCGIVIQLCGCLLVAGFFADFSICAGYVRLASETDRRRVLTAISKLLAPGQILFVGVTDPIHARIETPEEVRDRVLEAAEIIPVESLGTTDDCGFSPFADNTSTSRDTAFAKVRSRVEGTRLASQILGL
jgi:5-methyltetrahydropteroyltriglutamate--homocysteine methyltransferase